MKPMLSMKVAAAAVLVLGTAPAARAQAAPDTAGLARAVGALLVDSVVPRLSRDHGVYLRDPATPFDSAVAAVLREVPGVKGSGARPDTVEWIGTLGFTLRGDTAAVLVEVGTSAPGEGPIDTYVEHNAFLFVPGPSGWRFVRREFVQGADFGPVRG
jgi:hypothetical protein